MLKSIRYRASKAEKSIFWIWTIAGILTEFHAILRKLYPEIAYKKVEWFLKPGYRLLDPAGLTFGIQIQWYFKMIFDQMPAIAAFFTIGILVYDVSKKLFYVALTWSIYYLLDTWFFAWDFKTNTPFYFSLMGVIAITGFLITYRKFKIKKVDR